MYGIMVRNTGMQGYTDWCKRNGEIELYATREEAEKVAQQRNDRQGPVNSFNHYWAETVTEDIYNQTENEEEKTMSNTFKSITGITYTSNDMQTRFYTIDAEGKKTRISRKAYEEARKDYNEEKLAEKIDAKWDEHTEKVAEEAKADHDQLEKDRQWQEAEDKVSAAWEQELTSTEEPKTEERLTTKDEGVWQYLTLRRPPMPGGIPTGAIEVGEFDDPFIVMGSGTARGWATYDRELTEQELADYEMVPMVIDDKGPAEEQQTDEAWEAEAEEERKTREAKIAEDAKATEDAVNGIVTIVTEKAEEKPEKGKKKAKKEKTDKKDQPKPEAKEKAKKTRKSKDIAHEHKDGEVTITLTAKQVDFVLHLSDSCFWERGLDSILWCDVLVDEIGGQFEGKPMTIGAMISTLCEKGLGIRTKDRLTDAATGKSRKSTTFQLTEKGKEIAKELGLK